MVHFYGSLVAQPRWSQCQVEAATAALSGLLGLTGCGSETDLDPLVVDLVAAAQVGSLSGDSQTVTSANLNFAVRRFLADQTGRLDADDGTGGGVAVTLLPASGTGTDSYDLAVISHPDSFYACRGAAASAADTNSDSNTSAAEGRRRLLQADTEAVTPVSVTRIEVSGSLLLRPID